jgi:hypothetical protein
MNQGIAELPALVQRIRDVRTAMAWDAAGRRELPEKESQTVLVRRDLRVNFGIASLQIGVCVQRGATMSGTCNVNDVCVMFFDQAIQVNVNEVLPR